MAPWAVQLYNGAFIKTLIFEESQRSINLRFYLLLFGKYALLQYLQSNWYDKGLQESIQELSTGSIKSESVLDLVWHAMSVHDQ